MRIVYWGTYDKGKPRNRIMLQGLRASGVEVIECHKDVWSGIEDKSQVGGWGNRIKTVVKWLSSYPYLLYRYLRLPPHNFVVVGYMGQLDVILLWPFAKIKGIPIIWDAFLSLYNTVVEDRKLIGPHNPLAFVLFAWEWLACRCADCIVLDTEAHGQYFTAKFNLPKGKVERVFVGAEDVFFQAQAYSARDNHLKNVSNQFTVLFYGQYIPLHGIEYIVQAAKLTEHENIHWVLIGRGQERSRTDEMIKQLQLKNLTCLDWVPYDDLVGWLRSVHVCLGVFGDTEKAKWVIPNKVFQILAAGRPLITADTPAIRELISDAEGICLVPVANSKAIAEAVIGMKNMGESYFVRQFHAELHKAISPSSIGKTLVRILTKLQQKGFGRDDRPS